jgi:hypothetical protein
MNILTIGDKELESRIDGYDMSAITQRFADEKKISLELAISYERELKRYFFMCGAYKKHYGMGGKVDDLWHTFIIHTKEYTNFCDLVFGTYLHHVPISAPEEEKRSIATMLHYMRFLVDYFRHYEEIPPTEIWPLSRQLFGEVHDLEKQPECLACSGCIECNWQIISK